MSSLLSCLPSSTIEVSIHYGDDHRRMVFSTMMPWTEVRSAILSCFLLSASSSDYRFSYCDDEGDLIAVEHESEYSIAKQSAMKGKNLLELRLVKISQNGSSENDDFSGLEDNSDLEESYVALSLNAKANPAEESVGKEENKDQSNVNGDAREEEKEDDKVDDALSALNEAEQQRKIPAPDTEAQSSPPPSVNDPPTVADLCEPIIPVAVPDTLPAVVVQDSVSSPSSKCEAKNSSGGADADAAIGVMLALLSNGDLEDGLWRHMALSVINYFLSRASPIEAELIRSCQSSLEERLNYAMKTLNPKGFLGRFLSRRLFPKQKGQKKVKKSIKPKSKPAADQQPIASPPSLSTTPSPLSSASSSSSAFVSSSSGRAVHVGVRCDECNIGPIIGARYHCITCDENDGIRQNGGWDCCEECERKTKHCSSGHVLIKMKAPAKIVVEKEQPSEQFLASGQPVIYDAFAHFGDESKAVPMGVIHGSSSTGDEKKVEKKSSKKKEQKAKTKKLVKYLLSQFADESFTSSADTDNDDDKAQKRLAKKIEKQKKKAAKAAQKAEKLLLKKAKKGEKKSTVKAEKKEEESVEKKEEANKNEMEIDEQKAEVKEIEKEKQQSPLNSSDRQEHPAAAAPDCPVHEPIIKNDSSPSSAISSPIPPVYEPPRPSLEQKSNADLPVPLPVALPVPVPVTSSLPAITPAPVFQPINLLPPNPFTFPSPSLPSPSPSGPPDYSDQLAQLTAMGFPKERSLELLRYYGGDLRKALNRLL